MTKTFRNTRSLDTALAHIGSDPARFDGAVAPPAQRASTILIARAEDLYDPTRKTYGIEGMAAHDALKQALCAVEGASDCFLTPSGLFACILPFLAVEGRHILVTDNVYAPTRRFCERTLRRLGREITYFDPAIGAGIADLIRSDTCLIFLESPGSLTMEVIDTPAIVEVARARGIPTALDNTWSAGVYHQPLALGVDIAVQATTKYQSGHSDTISGAVLTKNTAMATRLHETYQDMGVCIAAEDAWLVLRGMRSLGVRLRRAESSGIKIASWLSDHPRVAGVYHPALPGSADHALWARDFSGAAGLFSFALPACEQASVHAFLNALTIFGLGYSWGGYESLAICCDPQIALRARPPSFPGSVIRLGIGLEDPDDLIADLENALSGLPG